MGIRKNLTMLLATAMLLSPIANCSVYAAEAENTTSVVESSIPQANDKGKYEVNCVVDSSWEGNYTGTISVTNTGTEVIKDWTLEFESNDEIVNLWNAKIVKHEGNKYTIKNVDWNKDIAVGQKVSFGYIASTKGGQSLPTNCIVGGVQSSANTSKVDVSKQNKDTYTADKFEVKYVVDSSWNDGYNGKFIIKNIGTEIIKDWKLEFDSENKINNVWGAEIEKNDGKNYIIKNAGWNKDIKPGESVEVGFFANKNTDEILIPQIYSIPGYEEQKDASDYEVKFDVNSKWDGGYTGNITITNISKEVINNWQLSFDLADKIANVWNAQMVKNESGHYVINNDGNNGVLKPGESVTFGYQASYTGDDTSKAENMGLKAYAFNNDGDKDYDGDGIKNSMEEVIGSDKNRKDTDNDGVLDSNANFKMEKTIGDNVDITKDVKVKVDLDLTGVQAESFKVETVPEGATPELTSIPGNLGSACKVSVDGAVKGQIQFEFSKSYLADPDFVPSIYEVERNELTKVATTVNGNVATANIVGAGLYVILNETEYNKIWETDIKPYDPNTKTSTSLDVALVIDSSWSMTVNDSTNIRKKVAKEFVNKLSSSDRAAVIDFDGSAKLYSGFTNNKSTLYSAIDRIDSDGGTSLAAGISTGLGLFNPSTYNNPTAKKCIIMLTDGDGTYSTSLTSQANGMEVIIYTVGLGSGVNKNVLVGIATGTGGSYYIADTAGDLYSVFDEVQQDAELFKDTDNDGISDYYEKKLASGEMRLGTGALLSGMSYTNPDSDGDGKKDGEELAIENKNGRVFARLISNPVVAD